MIALILGLGILSAAVVYVLFILIMIGVIYYWGGFKMEYFTWQDRVILVGLFLGIVVLPAIALTLAAYLILR